jgi:hypothetical protein
MQELKFKLETINFYFKLNGVSVFINWQPLGPGLINNHFHENVYRVRVGYKGKEMYFDTGFTPKVATSQHLIKTAIKTNDLTTTKKQTT